MNLFFPGVASQIEQDFKYYMLNNIYITPSEMLNYSKFKNALELVGTERIIYSVDYSYYPNEGAREFLENARISDEAIEK